PAAAMAWAADLPAGTRENAMRSAVLVWGQADPRSAVDWWTKNNSQASAAPNEVLGRIISMWTSSDPASAMAWANSVPEEPTRQSLLVAIAGEIAKNNPKEAAAIAGTLTGKAQNQAVSTVAARWSRSDPSA